MEHTIIVGAGPCGIACALALQEKGIQPLIIEKGNIVHTIYRFPTHQTFFSSSRNLEVGNIPFVTDKQKPVRNDALAYYREVVCRNNLRILTYEKVEDIRCNDTYFEVKTKKNEKEKSYQSKHVIVATGYYDQPKHLHIPGGDLPKVMHYFKEAHPYYDADIVIIGGRNSAVDAALELYHAGAKVTVLYRGETYSSSIKPWILPNFESLVRKGKLKMAFNAIPTKITQTNVYYEQFGEERMLNNDFVFAMTGYQPDISFLKRIGVQVEEQSGRPVIHKTYETNIPNLYVAGVVISGYNGNETFIENGRLHGEVIANSIMLKDEPKSKLFN